MPITLSEQLEEYRAGWMQRVPADRRAMMERHIAHLAATGAAQNAKQVGDQERLQSSSRMRTEILSIPQRYWRRGLLS